MDAALQTQLTIAALVCSVLALFFSLVAAFPGLKVVLAAFRDGVLWFALFLVIGGVSFLVWQQVQKLPPSQKVGQAAGWP
jgi:hypothetical protein